jgi:hypothetical protein
MAEDAIKAAERIMEYEEKYGRNIEKLTEMVEDIAKQVGTIQKAMDLVKGEAKVEQAIKSSTRMVETISDDAKVGDAMEKQMSGWEKAFKAVKKSPFMTLGILGVSTVTMIYLIKDKKGPEGVLDALLDGFCYVMPSACALIKIFIIAIIAYFVIKLGWQMYSGSNSGSNVLHVVTN